MRLPNIYKDIFILFADNLQHLGRRRRLKVKSHWVLCELTFPEVFSGPPGDPCR